MVDGVTVDALQVRVDPNFVSADEDRGLCLAAAPCVYRHWPSPKVVLNLYGTAVTLSFDTLNPRLNLFSAQGYTCPGAACSRLPPPVTVHCFDDPLSGVSVGRITWLDITSLDIHRIDASSSEAVPAARDVS